MKVPYQADNDLRKAIVRGAVRREPQMNFRSAQAARLDGLPDPEVLALAADEGRIRVSHDFQTMPMYFRQFSPGPMQPRSIVGQARHAGRRVPNRKPWLLCGQTQSVRLFSGRLGQSPG